MFFFVFVFVLGGGQVFLLVNEDTVKRYKSALADEIEPVIAELIERAQQGLSILEKKEHTLQTKVILFFNIFVRTSYYIFRLKILNPALKILVPPQNMKLAVFSN